MRPFRRYGNKVFVSLLFSLLALTLPQASHARYASIVVDADSGRVLHARNADTRNYPASLTKMMTLYLAFEAIEEGRLHLRQLLKVSRRAAGQPASKLGLKAGESIRVEDAILGLVVKSANDVATVVAEAVGGSEVKFARMMTRKARELGMRHTSFRNASGLPNRRQLSTARDMARLARALLRDYPQYYAYFSRPTFSYRGVTHDNHNGLLHWYDGTDGIKTGYIRASGFNLVASVQRDEQRLIGVVFGGRSARSRDRHMGRLLDSTFARLAAESPPPAAPVPAHKPEQRLAAAAAAPSGKAVAGTSTAAERELRLIVGPPAVEETSANWAVQVGAYSRYATARKRVLAAAGRVPSLLLKTGVAIEPINEDGEKLYRARLIGLDEGTARAACRALKRHRFRCVVVPTDSREADSGQISRG